MNAIHSIINTLTIEEKQMFLLQLHKKNKRSDTKNVQLFKLLETSGNTTNIDVLIYNKKAKAAYHALCKRLHDNLIDFIATKRFEIESSEEMDCLKLLLASRNFLEQNQYTIGLKTINKAEKKAKLYNLYSILNEIYYTKIQYTHQFSNIDLTQLLYNFKLNKDALQKEENLVLFYATVKNELVKRNESVKEIVLNNLSKFKILDSTTLNFKSLFKILEIINDAANITRDYHTILPFVEEIYTSLHTTKGYDSQKQNFYHIQVLYYIANLHFRNKNFELSKKHLKEMLLQMESQNNKYYHRFYTQYTLLLALNYNYSRDSNKAITLIENYDFNLHKEEITYILDLQLALSVFYFQQHQFKKALHQLNTLYRSDHWYIKKSCLIWVIKKNIIEILLHIELNNINVIDSRLKSFKKNYFSILKAKNELQVLHFVSLISQLHYHPEKLKSATFKQQVQQLNIAQQTQTGDIFNISFYAWLTSKLNKTHIYETTLQLLY